jgi:2-keto-4-pentenoate hydratase/2-oxohepta-3-ene-1,7-dioic acid hydratase in catechol pathway
MKLATYYRDNETRLAVVDGDSLVDLQSIRPDAPTDLRAALSAGFDLKSAATKAAEAAADARIPISDVRFAPLVPEPGKIVCLGLNYYDHAKEGGREKPEYPWFFLRCASSLLAHGDTVERPLVSERLDYEAELAVVIGQRVPRHVPKAQALAYVFGYSCFNDVSVRDYQKRTPQWTIGKIFDRTGPFGPWLVTADELPAGATGLRIQCRVNGVVTQDANTDDMIWGVAETISLLSDALTLEPGDVIAMGTPAGVGQSRQPPLWLRAGDTVDVEIDRIGTLRNEVRQEGAAHA